MSPFIFDNQFKKFLGLPESKTSEWGHGTPIYLPELIKDLGLRNITYHHNYKLFDLLRTISLIVEGNDNTTMFLMSRDYWYI